MSSLSILWRCKTAGASFTVLFEKLYHVDPDKNKKTEMIRCAPLNRDTCHASVDITSANKTRRARQGRKTMNNISPTHHASYTLQVA